MKKCICLILCLMLIFAAAAVGSAATYTDQATVTIEKVYRLQGAGTSPAETFTLQQVGAGRVTEGDAASAPNLGAITGASFAQGSATAAGAKANITIQLPAYTTVGIYEYTLREVATNQTAGVTYHTGDIKLVVSVLNDESGNMRVAAVHTESAGGEKCGSISNTYSAGTLHVTKTVTGNLGDKNKYFTFQVELTGETGKTYPASFRVTGGTNGNNPTEIRLGVPTTFYLKDGETISIENLPYGVAFAVTESDYTGEKYVTTKSGDTGTIQSGSQSASFTNRKQNDQIDTGIQLDDLPFVLILGVSAGAAVLFLIRRRRQLDD